MPSLQRRVLLQLCKLYFGAKAKKGPLPGSKDPSWLRKSFALVNRQEVHPVDDRLPFGTHGEADEVVGSAAQALPFVD